MRLQSYKFNLKDLVIVLLAMLSIAPGYLEIMGINIGTILIIVIDFLGISILCCGRKSTNFTIYTIVFFLWSLYAILHYIVAGAYIDAFLFFSKTFILYFVFDNILIYQKNIQKLFDAIEIASIIACCVGLLEEFLDINLFALIGGVDISDLYNMSRFGITRILSFSSQTINYGCYLLFMTSISIFCINSKFMKRKLYYVAYVLQWLNLFFTMSRSVIIIAIFANIVLNFMLGKKKIILNTLKYICIISIPVIMIFLIFPNILSLVVNVFYMLIAVFDSSFISKFASSYGAENINAFGERNQLYEWVFNSMGHNWIFGNGLKSKFNYSYSYNINLWTIDAVKKSIENQYLYVLYQKGIVGLLLEGIFYLSILSASFRIRKLRFTEYNNNYINVFCKCVFIILSSYCILIFGVSRQSEENLFIILMVSFLIIINKIRLYKD